jgi:protein FrlC
MPLFELMSELNDLDYKGFLTIELVTGYINEPGLYALRAIKNLRSMLNGN